MSKANGASETPPAEKKFLTLAEAASRLGLQVRGFQKMRARLKGIPGQKMVPGPHGAAWVFPEESIDALAAQGETEEDDDATAAILREHGRAVKDILSAAVEAITGVVPLVLKHAEQMGHRVDAAETKSIEAVEALAEAMIGLAKVEAEGLRAQGDQTVRLKQVEAAHEGFRLLTPVAKVGIARLFRMSAVAQDGQAEAVTAIVRRLVSQPDRLARLKGVLDDEQWAAVGDLIGAVEGQRNMRKALGILKRLRPEQGVQIQEILDEKELAALSQILDTIEEERASS
jgi:hypothetical protein